LLVFHKGGEGVGFAICLKCGYADSERRGGGKGRGQMGLPPSLLGHASVSAAEPWKVCWNNADQKAPKVLRHRILAAKETTDVMLLDFSDCLGQNAVDGSLIATLAYALQRAAARRLDRTHERSAFS
jgi:DEAD/DEAH box helicase domain-containing protein